MTDDIKQIIEDEEFPKEVDEFIDGLIEEGYDIEDIEAVLTDDDFLAKLDDLDAEYEDEGEQLDEISNKKKRAYLDRAKNYEWEGGEVTQMLKDNPAKVPKLDRKFDRRQEIADKVRKSLTKEETESMMKDISKGKLGFGKVTPILANAAYCAIKRMPEDERAGVIEAVWNDQDEFRFLITSQN